MVSSQSQQKHQRLKLTFDRRPLDLFPHILLLLRLESELNKDLLQLLVDVVDTQLFERIILEDLESANPVSLSRVISITGLTRYPTRQ